MVDIESLGVHADAVVLSIGAVKFSLRSNDTWHDLEEDCFHEVLNTADQSTRRIEVSTVMWWMNQDEAAREVLHTPGRPVPEVLDAFTGFMSTIPLKERRLWGNGATFDNIILRNLWNDFGMTFPVSFRQDMDLRTLKHLTTLSDKKIKVSSIPKHRVKHNALDDARAQVLKAQAYAPALGLQ